MRDVEEVTARGRGFWGATYEFELVVRKTTLRDSSGRHEQTTTTFDLVVLNAAVGRRGFASEAERAAFLEEQFSDLEIEPVVAADLRTRHHPLSGLLGDTLATVTFVHDYVQLGFDKPPLSLYVWPRIHTTGGVLQRTEAGYLDAIVGLIGCALTGVDELLDYGLVLDFSVGTRLAIPLDGRGLTGPEAAYFAGDGPDGWMVWRPGDYAITWIAAP